MDDHIVERQAKRRREGRHVETRAVTKKGRPGARLLDRRLGGLVDLIEPYARAHLVGGRPQGRGDDPARLPHGVYLRPGLEDHHRARMLSEVVRPEFANRRTA